MLIVDVICNQAKIPMAVNQVEMCRVVTHAPSLKPPVGPLEILRSYICMLKNRGPIRRSLKNGMTKSIV